MPEPPTPQPIDIRVQRDRPQVGWWTFTGVSEEGREFLQWLVETDDTGPWEDGFRMWDGVSASVNGDEDYLWSVCGGNGFVMEVLDADGSVLPD